MAIFNSLEDCKKAIAAMEAAHLEIPPTILEENERLEAEQRIEEEELIFSTMAAHNKFMTPEKEQVVREMTDQLMLEGDEAKQPCLLLGKVQCGKTDTFLSIMSLCFDRGIDIAVVLTKGTNTLASQTIERLKSVEKGFGRFLDNNGYNQKVKIDIYDVLDLYKRGGLSLPQLNDPNRKFIIVAKKETVNMNDLIKLFEESELMRNKNVLVCDDEADFASRAYLTKKKSKTEKEIKLLKIAELIETFIKLPKLCRYLQITATPYSLYLQPDGAVKLREGEEASCWLPRYTALVPIHNKYIGGKQYFVDSQNWDFDTDPDDPKPLSMYCLLRESVSNECRDILACRNEWFKEANIHSQTLRPLSKAIISYIFATAVRVIQERWAYEKATPEEKEKMKVYKSSCLIHCEIAKNHHKWQEDIITEIINDFITNVVDKGNSDLYILDIESEVYNSLKKSNELGVKEGLIREKFPSFLEVEAEVKHLMNFHKYKINVVNSDNPVRSMLNDEGQLKLEETLNFFIGGSILDRGITIDNMLCFFYGRKPGKFQMDTVLQHARMYGAREKKDMACTRFFTTDDIYDVLRTINEFDDFIYDYLSNNRNSLHTDEFTSVVIGYDKRISPSAQNKYTPANTKVLKPYQRILPVAFQTGDDSEISETIAEIDKIIRECPDFKNISDENPFFKMDVNTAATILHLISSTFRYNEEFENIDREWSINEMITPLDYCSYDNDGYIYCLYRENRNASRKRDRSAETKGIWMDAPDDGHNDTAPSREMAIDRPVLMLLRQNGLEKNGWRGTPFFWPVLMMPSDLKSGFFTVDGNKKYKNVDRKQFRLVTPSKLPAEDILYLTIKKNFFFEIISGEKKEEERELKHSTADAFIAKDFLGKPILIESADPDKYYDLSSYNDGLFPWEIKDYKYIYFRCSCDFSGSQALVEINPKDPYYLAAKQGYQKDVIYNSMGIGVDAVDTDVAKWSIIFNLGKVIEVKLSSDDEKLNK